MFNFITFYLIYSLIIRWSSAFVAVFVRCWPVAVDVARLENNACNIPESGCIFVFFFFQVRKFNSGMSIRVEVKEVEVLFLVHEHFLPVIFYVCRRKKVQLIFTIRRVLCIYIKFIIYFICIPKNENYFLVA